MSKAEIKNTVGAFLAIAMAAAFIVIINNLMFHEVPKANARYFDQSLIALISFTNIGLGFFLGSAFGSMIKNQLFKPVEPPAPAAQTTELVKEENNVSQS